MLKKFKFKFKSTPPGETDLPWADWERAPLVGQNPALLHPSPRFFGAARTEAELLQRVQQNQNTKQIKIQEMHHLVAMEHPHTIRAVHLVICQRCFGHSQLVHQVHIIHGGNSDITFIHYIYLFLITKGPKQDSFPLWPQSQVPAKKTSTFHEK